MSLVYMQGFDNIGTGDVAKVCHSSSYATDCSIVAGRQGNAIQKNGTSNKARLYFYWQDFGVPVGAEMIIGFAARITNSTNGFWLFPLTLGAYGDAWGLRIGDGNLIHRVAWDDPYVLMPMNKSQWYYLEWRYYQANTGGRSEIRVDGVSLWDYTGDTKHSTSYNPYAFCIEMMVWAIGQIDDLYIVHVDGSGINDFLGDCRVDTIVANGAGNSTDFTPSAGANYECIDDAPTDTANWVEAIGDADKDTYNYGSVPTGIDDAAIYGVSVQSVAKRTAPSSNVALRNLLRSNSVDYQGSLTHSLADNWNNHKQDIWEIDPDDSGAWTQAKINACEFGMELEQV